MFVYEFFPGLGDINNTFKYEEYGKVIGYVSLDNISLNSAFNTEFVLIRSITVTVFLVTLVGLFTVGIWPC